MKTEQKKLILALLMIPLTIALVYEYYALLRCMFSGGALTAIAVPAFWFTSAWLIMRLSKKRAKTPIAHLLRLVVAGLVAPIVAVFFTSLLALPFGIEVVTW